MPKVILISGMPRSGSTWMYNIARLMLTKYGPSTYGAWIKEYDSSNSAEVHVVKIHDPIDEHLAEPPPSLILSSWRDLQGTMESLKGINFRKPEGKKWFPAPTYLESFEGLLRRAIWYYPFWAEKTDYEMPFEQFILNPNAEAAKIALLLKLDLTSSQVDEIVKEVKAIKPPARDDITSKDDHDVVTLLHPEHLGRGLPLDEQEQRIQSRVANEWPGPLQAMD